MKKSKELQELFSINKSLWDQKSEIHYSSEFYDNESFIAGRNSLDPIVLKYLPEVQDKKILHLQCHFGQDSISLARMGASVTGIDLSKVSIDLARSLNEKTGMDVKFIESNVYDIREHLDDTFDLIFTSYGAICWLPDLKEWASLINYYLKSGGMFYMAEFHPYIYTLDFKKLTISYPYFNIDQKAYIETETGTYADFAAGINADEVFWLHSLDEVFNSLMETGLELKLFKEYPYSPYDCFEHTREIEPGKYCIGDFGVPLPHTYALQFTKK